MSDFKTTKEGPEEEEVPSLTICVEMQSKGLLKTCWSSLCLPFTRLPRFLPVQLDGICALY